MIRPPHFWVLGGWGNQRVRTLTQREWELVCVGGATYVCISERRFASSRASGGAAAAQVPGMKAAPEDEGGLAGGYRRNLLVPSHTQYEANIPPSATTLSASCSPVRRSSPIRVTSPIPINAPTHLSFLYSLLCSHLPASFYMLARSLLARELIPLPLPFVKHIFRSSSTSLGSS